MGLKEKTIGFLLLSGTTNRAANLVQPKKGIIMAKKGNFQQKRGIFKHEPLNHARHTSHAESIHIYAVNSHSVQH